MKTALVILSGLLLLSGTARAGKLQPNDCAIVAVEKQQAIKAATRLRGVNVWSRLLFVRYRNQSLGHVYCAFQPRRRICVYDEHGTFVLRTESRDPAVIGRAIAQELWVPIISARFVE